MSRVLYLNSSPRGSASYSNQVAARVIDELRRRDGKTGWWIRAAWS